MYKDYAICILIIIIIWFARQIAHKFSKPIFNKITCLRKLWNCIQNIKHNSLIAVHAYASH